MSGSFVICDSLIVNAKVIPAQFYGPPGLCEEGIYDTFYWRGLECPDWTAHLERLLGSCRALGYDADAQAGLVDRGRVVEMLTKNGLDQSPARVRCMVFDSMQQGTGEVRFQQLWTASAVEAEQRFPEVGIVCSLGQHRRMHGDFRYNHKLAGVAYVAKDLELARQLGYKDVLYLNNRNELCEAAYSNIWLVLDGALYTPPFLSPCLPGITRQKILVAARKAGMTVVEDKPLNLQLLASADEVFLSSAIRGLQPVSAVEGVAGGEFPAPGAFCRELTALLDV